jgi:hypothetical protein
MEAEAEAVPQGIGADIIPGIVSPLLRRVWPFRHDIHIGRPVLDRAYTVVQIGADHQLNSR